MSHRISIRNVNQAFKESWWYLRAAGVRQETRNGPVLRAPGLFITEYSHPKERILWSPRRDANPIFHLAECLWMISGSSEVGFLAPFNSNISTYAEESGIIWGAYGKRWRGWFEFDQLVEVVRVLREDPTTRQAVVQMWDADSDLGTKYKDRPCNISICFEAMGGALDMTVFNRSNDMLWGAYGANVVHMSFLQEVLAHELDIPVGTYRQVSNNFHVYLQNPMVHSYLESPPFEDYDEYSHAMPIVPILKKGETLEDLTHDCHTLVEGTGQPFKTSFVEKVGHPLLQAYKCRRAGVEFTVDHIPNCDWKYAFQMWCGRRGKHASE